MAPKTSDFYAEQHPQIIHYLTRLTRCRQRAEDLAQSVWLRLLTAQGRGDALPQDAAALRGYLFAAARNLFIDEYARKHGATRTRSADPHDFDSVADDSGVGSNPEDLAAREELRKVVRDAIDKLPAEQVRVINMWSQGSSIRQMASAAAAPVDTVLSRKKYAFARMRIELAGAVAELA
jgi:RNA polymerase sigma-70 factor (ECF subfamily)